MFVEPLTGRRVVSLTGTRGAVDWALQIQDLLTVQYPDASQVCLVMDNLNTHDVSSLYKAFPPEEARALAKRLEIHYTPKHGSWLNVAECELSALSRQCLNRRIPDFETMQNEVKHWEMDRNNTTRKVDWQFTTDNARIKLKHLYPNI
jgi:transposase